MFRWMQVGWYDVMEGTGSISLIGWGLVWILGKNNRFGGWIKNNSKWSKYYNWRCCISLYGWKLIRMLEEKIQSEGMGNICLGVDLN